VHDLVLRASDKRVLHRCAAEVGLAPPRSILCSNRDEVDAASRALGLPLVLKPVRSFVRARHERARLARSAAALEDAVVAVGMPLTAPEYLRAPTIVSCGGVRTAQAV